MKPVDQVLGADIACGAGRIWATPNSTKRGIKAARAGVICSKRVGKPHIPRIVEMQRQRQIGICRKDGADKRRNLTRIREANRVGNRNSFDPHGQISVDGPQSPLGRLRPLEGAAKGGCDSAISKNPAARDMAHNRPELVQ